MAVSFKTASKLTAKILGRARARLVVALLQRGFAMGEEERKAWDAGRWGSGPPPSGGSAFDAWQQGNATRQNEASNQSSSAAGAGSTFSPTFPTFPTAPTGGPAIPGSGTSTATGDMPVRGMLGCLVVVLLLFVGGPLLTSFSALWLGLFPLWVCLYPVSSLGTFASGIGIYTLLQQAAPKPGPLNMNALAWALPVGLAVFVMTSRLEHRFARHPTYRISRHILRLGTFGLVASILFLQYAGRNLTLPRRVPDLAHLRAGLSNPLGIGVVLGVVVLMHFLLWPDNAIRRIWHGVLEVLRLRPKGI